MIIGNKFNFIFSSELLKTLGFRGSLKLVYFKRLIIKMTLFYIENRVFPFVGFENDIMPILLLKIFSSLQLVNLYKILEIHQDFLYHLMVLFVATPTYHLHHLF